jgi:hypothetical protein
MTHGIGRPIASDRLESASSAAETSEHDFPWNVIVSDSFTAPGVGGGSVMIVVLFDGGAVAPTNSTVSAPTSAIRRVPTAGIILHSSRTALFAPYHKATAVSLLERGRDACRLEFEPFCSIFRLSTRYA